HLGVVLGRRRLAVTRRLLLLRAALRRGRLEALARRLPLAGGVPGAVLRLRGGALALERPAAEATGALRGALLARRALRLRHGMLQVVVCLPSSTRMPAAASRSRMRSDAAKSLVARA